MNIDAKTFNSDQFTNMINSCVAVMCDDYDIKYTLIRYIICNDDIPRYRLNLTIVNKCNNVTDDFCHFVARDDSRTETIAKTIEYLQSSDEVPNTVHDVVNVYLAGFMCAGGEL